MSGICGMILHSRHTRVDLSHLAPMLQALGTSGDSAPGTVSLGAVGLGSQGFAGALAGVAELQVRQHSLALACSMNVYNLPEVLPPDAYRRNPVQGLLDLYAHGGMAFVERLRGEFVLALWDGGTDTLYLATDRFRVQPLFYYQDADKFIFASRMQSLLACPFPATRTIHAEAIVDVMDASMVPTPKTIFREVKKLPPGSMLTYRGGACRVTPYWEINFLQPSAAGAAELASALKVHFAEAVSVRLHADSAPHRLGTFLSGGVDSSTVTGVLTQLLQHPIKSFSIGFDEQRFNEISYARTAAQAFGAEHYEYFVSPRDAYEAIPVLLEQFDEPYGNASAIPTYFCALLARQHGVTTLYAGDGGDELFAGNERYATQRLFDYYARIPRWLREPCVRPLVFALADSVQRDPFVKAKKYIQRASVPYPERLSTYGLLNTVPLARLISPDLLHALGPYHPYQTIARYYHQAPARNELDRQLYIDLKLAISDNDLFKVTRMTEAAGVAVHFPFLDHRLAEFAATIPARLKMRGRQLRSFFKQAYADVLPLATRSKQKHGFGLPIPVWLRTDKQLNDMMRDLVLSPRSLQRGYFNPTALTEIVTCHETDETSSYGPVLWHLMMLELWHRRYVN